MIRQVLTKTAVVGNILAGIGRAGLSAARWIGAKPISRSLSVVGGGMGAQEVGSAASQAFFKGRTRMLNNAGVTEGITRATM